MMGKLPTGNNSGMLMGSQDFMGKSAPPAAPCLSVVPVFVFVRLLVMSSFPLFPDSFSKLISPWYGNLMRI